MKETGILNRDLAGALAGMGHLDQLMVVDAGCAIPQGIKTVDLSLKVNTPTVMEVLEELLQHFSIEKVYLAKETKEVSPTRFDAFVEFFGKDIEQEVVGIDYIRKASHNVKLIIRTGDFTAFSNVLLVSGGGDRWYCEK